MSKLRITAAALLVLAILPACTPVGAGLAVGSAAGTAAAREGGLKASLEDARISAKIQDLWLKYNFEMFSKLNLTVDQGRVLITGVVQQPEHRVEAVRLAWQADGVRQVINEIKVDKSEGIKGWARDNWISGRLRAAILFDKDIQGINYSIDTVQSVVYLMGVAQNQTELNKVMTHARSVPYVKQVVSYVKLAGTPVNQVIPPQGQQTTSSTGMSNNPAPVYTQPLGQYPTPPPASAQPQAPYGYAVPNPVQPYPVTGTPGRPAPIVDQGF